MTDVDPITGPGHTDQVHYVAVPGERPYVRRVTWEQVNEGTDGAVQLDWIDDGRWWVAMNPLSDEEQERLVSEEEYQRLLQAMLDDRSQLLASTRQNLIDLGLTAEQADVILEGK